MDAATAAAPAAALVHRVPEDQAIVLFGATGDLAGRKLLPGMFHLTQVGLMSQGFTILGAARHGMEDEEFREMAREAVEESGRRPASMESWDEFAARLRFV